MLLYFIIFVKTTGEGAAFTCPPGPICRNETVAGSDPMGGLNIDMGCTDGTELLGDGVGYAHGANIFTVVKLGCDPP